MGGCGAPSRSQQRRAGSRPAAAPTSPKPGRPHHAPRGTPDQAARPLTQTPFAEHLSWTRPLSVSWGQRRGQASSEIRLWNASSPEHCGEGVSHSEDCATRRKGGVGKRGAGRGPRRPARLPLAAEATYLMLCSFLVTIIGKSTSKYLLGRRS